MKHSISGKLTKKLALIMVVTLAILFFSSFHVVSRIVNKETQSYESAIAGIFADLIGYEAEGMHIPVDTGMTEQIRYYGEYICRWYRIDYTYAYSLSADDGTVLVLGQTKKEDSDVGDRLPVSRIGKQMPYTPCEEELVLWNGEAMGRYLGDSQLKNARDYAVVIDDTCGNRVIVGVGMSSTGIRRTIAKDFAIVAAVIVAVFAAMTALTYYIIRKSVFKPAKALSESMTAFITDGKRSEAKLDESGNDEFAMIAGAFNRMSGDIDTYLSDIERLTGQREREKAELEIASGIQQGFLPPARYVTKDHTICAMMTPAKNVGGDLYDYLRLDGDRVLLTVADVSGKGVAASMYMSVVLMLTRQFAKMGCSPAEILERTNEEISEKNPNMLFATVFVGIYDASDSTLTYANAGHNPPYLLRGEPLLLDSVRGTLLGIFPGETYAEEKAVLCPGDILFLCTDGVTEAVDTEKRFFGEERLKETLASFRASHRSDIVQFVYEKVRDFAGEADQYDDVTMLSLTVCDPGDEGPAMTKHTGCAGEAEG